MQSERKNLSERLLEFAASSVELAVKLIGTPLSNLPVCIRRIGRHFDIFTPFYSHIFSINKMNGSLLNGVNFSLRFVIECNVI